MGMNLKVRAPRPSWKGTVTGNMANLIAVITSNCSTMASRSAASISNPPPYPVFIHFEVKQDRTLLLLATRAGPIPPEEGRRSDPYKTIQRISIF